MSDHFLAVLSAVKAQIKPQNKDFEAGLVKLYTKLRVVMAKTYERGFGLVNITQCQII